MIKYWAGSPSSLQDFEACIKKMEAFMASKEYLAKSGSDWDTPESLFERVGDVGVIKISGHLIPGKANALYQMFGMQGYDNIKEAFVEAVADKKVKRIVMHVNSGGGAVDGVQDASEFIKTTSEVKPVSSYNQFACSAAYWLASSGGEMVVGNTSIIGSIGVLRVHREYSKYDEKDGVTTTVMRAGKYKALMNPYEPLTDEAKAESQQQLDDLYKIFVQAVADNRNTSYVVADTTMAQGKEFLGQRAIEAGLADKLGTFGQVLASNVASSVATPVVATTTLSDNYVISNLQDKNMKFNLTKEQLEALASGVPLASLVGEQEGTPENTEAPEGQNLASLEAQVTELSAKVNTLTAEVEAKTAEANSNTEALKNLAKIVQDSVTQMSVALNKKIEVEALSYEDLVKAHADTKDALGKTFKPNGVAKPTAKVETEEPNKETALLNAKFLAQAKSIKFI